MKSEFIGLFVILIIILLQIINVRLVMKKINDHVERVKLENIRLLDLLTDLEHELRALKYEDYDQEDTISKDEHK
jgi:hypothetical protein